MNAFLLLLASLFAAPALAAPTAHIIHETGEGRDVSYPQLTGRPDAKRQAAINDSIKVEAAGWACDANPDDTSGIQHSFNAESTLRLVDSHYLSYTIAFDYECGGPYPDAHMETRNIDLATGKLLTPADLFTNGIDATLGRLIVKDAKPQEDCEGIYDLDNWDPEMWEFYLTPDTIVFLPSLPHVVQACVEEFPVSTKALAPFLRPKR